MKADAKRTHIKVWDFKRAPADWFKRQQADQKATQELENNVKAIINQVRADGDKALIEFAQKFDKAELTAKTLQGSSGRNQGSLQQSHQRPNFCLKFMKERVSAFQKQLLNQTDNKDCR